MTSHPYQRSIIPNCCEICSQIPKAHSNVQTELAAFAEPGDDLEEEE